MAAPHNLERYGELWPPERIEVSLIELEAIKPWVTLSGGWAWHFMSPKGHLELKHAHDHKDIDIFVKPTDVAMVIEVLKKRDFNRMQTKYDRLPSSEDFRRYGKVSVSPRVIIDFFVREVPSRMSSGWKTVEPEYLLGLYSSIHSSDKCFAVQAASKLVARGIDPAGRPELVQIPR